MRRQGREREDEREDEGDTPQQTTGKDGRRARARRTGETADDEASGLLEEQPIVHFATYYLIDHTFLRMMTSSREYINSGAPPPR